MRHLLPRLCDVGIGLLWDNLSQSTSSHLLVRVLKSSSNCDGFSVVLRMMSIVLRCSTDIFRCFKMISECPPLLINVPNTFSDLIKMYLDIQRCFQMFRDVLNVFYLISGCSHDILRILSCVANRQETFSLLSDLN